MSFSWDDISAAWLLTPPLPLPPLPTVYPLSTVHEEGKDTIPHTTTDHRRKSRDISARDICTPASRGDISTSNSTVGENREKSVSGSGVIESAADGMRELLAEIARKRREIGA
jgi:hypothetical protein